jgi:hypothetical protein
VSLHLDSEEAIDYGKTISISLSRKLEWEQLSASLYSAWYLEEYDVEVYKAIVTEEETRYRVVDAYAEGYDLIITVNGSTATVAYQQVDMDSGVAPLTVEGGGTFIDGVISLTLDFILWYPAGVNYYNEMGYEEILTIYTD